MDNLKIGQIIVTQQQRDAVHMAIAPVRSKGYLRPGQHVSPQGDGVGGLVGIVDPFLRRDVKPGEIFWLFLYPGSIQSLRHDWTCQGFGDADVAPHKSVREASEEWLRNYANEVGIPLGMLLERHAGDREDWMPVEEFWEHYANVTGETIDPEDRYFSCAC